jgi:hypothetical protein
LGSQVLRLQPLSMLPSVRLLQAGHGHVVRAPNSAAAPRDHGCATQTTAPCMLHTRSRKRGLSSTESNAGAPPMRGTAAASGSLAASEPAVMTGDLGGIVLGDISSRLLTRDSPRPCQICTALCAV